jgi:hypothetical protein
LSRGLSLRKLIDSYRRGTVEAAARRRLAFAPLIVDDEDIERINETARRTDVAIELARRLPPEQFEALKARVLDERDYADIAGDLGCSEVVVRMRVRCAIVNSHATGISGMGRSASWTARSAAVNVSAVRSAASSGSATRWA